MDKQFPAPNIEIARQDKEPKKSPTDEYRYSYLRTIYSGYSDLGLKVRMNNRTYALHFIDMNYSVYSPDFKIQFHKTIYDEGEEITLEAWRKDRQRYNELYGQICDKAIECLFGNYTKQAGDWGYYACNINLQDIREMIK